MFRHNKKQLIYFCVVVLTILLISSLTQVLKSPALNILEYPLGLVSLLKHEIGGIIFYHRNLVLSERLRKENDYLKQKICSLNEITLENKRLEKLLVFKQKSPYKVIAARVIGRSSDNWSSTIIIDKGSYSGIRKGLAVISYLGLVGRVAETSEYTAKIMLISDSNIGVAALVQRSRQEGLVSGTLGSVLVMKYLPPEADISPSDLVITSGLTDVYPKGLIIGTVVSVGEEFSGLSRYAIIRPAVNLSNIEEVLVIIR
ncbi:rod shape-determining protein MreC [bacterium]|nr:MAG: rod shape-determining protein MreC [bacterium]